MKSIPQIAQALDLSSATIREYLNRFEEFFADPVEHEGLKEYPDETQELIEKIHGYYTKTDMTKEQIRVKLGGKPETADLPAEPQAQPGIAMTGMDAGQFQVLIEKMDRLTQVIEALTDALVKAGELGFANVKKAYSGNEKLNEITNHITDIIELSKGGDSENIEKNVVDADGTLIFSFGQLSVNAADSMHFAKAHKKPWLHIDLETEKNPGPMLRKWLAQFEIKVVNVAGRSATKVPGLKKSVNDIVALILKG